MGKTRDLVKKIRDTKGTFHAKMYTIKNRNIHKRDLHDPDDHDGVITHLEPDIQSQVDLRKHLYKQS